MSIVVKLLDTSFQTFRFLTVYANWENKGKLAFSRDGYTFVFHAATLPAGAWTKVRIEGDHKGTTLYINGEKAERLEGRVKQFYNYTHKRKDKMYMQETLVFPMRHIRWNEDL